MYFKDIFFNATAPLFLAVQPLLELFGQAVPMAAYLKSF